jgi:hypothetical protein
MATLLNFLDDLRDRLNDSADNQIPKATKVRYINHGIRATWPRLYKTVRDSTLVVAADDYEYPLPAAVGNNGKLLRVEHETGVGTNRFVETYDYTIVPGLTDPILQFDNTLPVIGAKIRITAAKPLTELVADGDTYDGPAQTDELPVLYAMGLSLTRRLDDRIDHRRLSTTTGTNQVGPDEIMTAGQFNFAQFELLLERHAMPLPTSGG